MGLPLLCISTKLFSEVQLLGLLQMENIDSTRAIIYIIHDSRNMFWKWNLCLFFQVREYLVKIEETETKRYVWLLMW